MSSTPNFTKIAADLVLKVKTAMWSNPEGDVKLLLEEMFAAGRKSVVEAKPGDIHEDKSYKGIGTCKAWDCA